MPPLRTYGHGEYPTGLQGSTANVHAPASNTAAVVTFAGVSGRHHAISGVAFSYKGGTPTGSLTIQSGSDTIFSIDLSAAGHDVIYFDPGIMAAAGEDLVITLGAGGSGITGKVSIIGHWTESA